MSGLFDRLHFLDLPSDLLQLVLSFVCPGTLSDGQILSILHHAVDRNGILERRARFLGPLRWSFYDELLLEERTQFLEDTGCEGYDR